MINFFNELDGCLYTEEEAIEKARAVVQREADGLTENFTSWLREDYLMDQDYYDIFNAIRERDMGFLMSFYKKACNQYEETNWEECFTECFIEQDCVFEADGKYIYNATKEVVTSQEAYDFCLYQAKQDFSEYDFEYWIEKNASLIVKNRMSYDKMVETYNDREAWSNFYRWFQLVEE